MDEDEEVYTLAYQQGFSFGIGYEEDWGVTNPYPEGSDDHRDWARGYSDGCDINDVGWEEDDDVDWDDDDF